MVLSSHHIKVSETKTFIICKSIGFSVLRKSSTLSVVSCGTMLYKLCVLLARQLPSSNQTDQGDETEGLEMEGLEEEGLKELLFVLA
jgi:hypothetical protein